MVSIKSGIVKNSRSGEFIDRRGKMVSGIRLAPSHKRMLRIGPCRIYIRGETKPCEVLDDGEIAIGDSVEWVEEAGI
ncbi:MAG: hypothetical protein U0401_26745 [Anaerolineae bacterium]